MCKNKQLGKDKSLSSSPSRSTISDYVNISFDFISSEHLVYLFRFFFVLSLEQSNKPSKINHNQSANHVERKTKRTNRNQEIKTE